MLRPPKVAAPGRIATGSAIADPTGWWSRRVRWWSCRLWSAGPDFVGTPAGAAAGRTKRDCACGSETWPSPGFRGRSQRLLTDLGQGHLGGGRGHVPPHAATLHAACWPRRHLGEDFRSNERPLDRHRVRYRRAGDGLRRGPDLRRTFQSCRDLRSRCCRAFQRGGSDPLYIVQVIGGIVAAAVFYVILSGAPAGNWSDFVASCSRARTSERCW
jgi:hypothetical protein